MYKVISANRGPTREPKNWRVFEKEAVEKHFGEVLDCNGEDGVSVLEAYNQNKDSIEYIRWYPDPELMTQIEYEGMVKQSEEIGDLPFLVNSAVGFKAVQCKDAAFDLWKKAGVHCPNYFSFGSIEEFYKNLDEAQFTYPFLVRANDSVAGFHTFLIKESSEVEQAVKSALSTVQTFNGIDSKVICVEFIDTVDKEKDVNFSFRIHATAAKVVSGYARVVSSDDWCAITAGKFNIKNMDNWIYYNILCEEVCQKYEKEICYAIESLGLNMQGVDVVIDQKTNKPCFLEVQPTYASGYPREGYCGYYKPFYNPSNTELVDYLTKNKSTLEKQIPMYYNNWLDKKNHFDLMYGSLKDFLNVRT